MEHPKIYPAMINVMRAVKAIGKDKQTTGFANFRYRGIDDVYNTLNPILAQYGVFVVPEILELTREERASEKKDKFGKIEQKIMAFVVAKVKYTFFAEDGSSVSCVIAGEGMDSGDKATPKALSIAMKYALFQTFCIPTEELADPDAETHRLLPTKQEIQQTRLQAVQENADPMTAAQQKALQASMKAKGLVTREDCLAELSAFFGRDVKTSKALSKADVSLYLDAQKSASVPDDSYM